MTDRDDAELGLVAGLEIHQQLDTETKLFCACPTDRREPNEATRTIQRQLHPTRSELGELDEAAMEESRIDRTFEYLAYPETCLVEEDEEPPGTLDEEALEVALEIAALLEMEPVDRAHVMRKIVVDGSNTGGFQRTALVATDGELETSEGTVRIEDLLLEEESAQRVEETADGVRYSLDRLGIPLVEIGTGPDITSPEQARETAEQLGMMLRSTGRVKRGLGTIRQDVNVSIADGARVEIKGVQQLEDIEDIVALEVDRQVALLEIAERLAERLAERRSDGLGEGSIAPAEAIGEPMDVTEAFADTESGVIRGALEDGGVVFAVRLAGFDGLLGRELVPDRRLGTELADHARRHGAGGIFHTDELPAYGITEAEVQALREAVDAGADDAVALIAADPSVAEVAIDAVAARARQALDGVPEETRGANEDGTTRYLRPLPGAARMYPETDVPPVDPDLADISTPELLTERVDRYVTALDLDSGLAEQVAFGPHMPTFERAIDRGIDATLAASTLASTLTELRRDDVPIDRLDAEATIGALELVQDGDVPSEGLPELLAGLAAHPDRSPADLAAELGLESAGDEAVREVVVAVLERNAEQVEAEGMGAFSALMGECMGELRGKAEGDVVSDVLREEIQART